MGTEFGDRAQLKSNLQQRRPPRERCTRWISYWALALQNKIRSIAKPTKTGSQASVVLDGKLTLLRL